MTSIVEVLASISVSVTILLLAGVAALSLLRRAPAASRHFVCAATLGGTIVLFLLALAPAWGSRSTLLSIAPLLATVTTLAGFGSIHSSGGLASPGAIGWIWACGALALLIRTCSSNLLARMELRRCAPLDDEEWTADLRDLARQLGQASIGIPLRIGPVSSPLACGLLRPAIVVPEAAAGWDRSRRRSVLLHELAHLRRGDLWTNQMANLACALFWFHPLVWILAGRLNHEQELACDDAVLEGGVAPSSYATLLLDAVRELPSNTLFLCPMTGRNGVRILRARLKHLLSGGAARRMRPLFPVQAGALFLLAVMVLSLVRPSQAQEVYEVGGDVVAPRLLQKSEPAYTQEAKDARIEGVVVLRLVVGKDGRAHDIEVVKSLEPGLDGNAIKAVATWVFSPGTRKGQPVAVRAKVETHFRLK